MFGSIVVASALSTYKLRVKILHRISVNLDFIRNKSGLAKLCYPQNFD